MVGNGWWREMASINTEILWHFWTFSNARPKRTLNADKKVTFKVEIEWKQQKTTTVKKHW